MNHPDFDAYSVPAEDLIPYGPEAVGSFPLYSYEYIDNLHFLRRPADLIADAARCHALEKAVAARFTEAGWEGTGKLSLLWLPPFVLPYAPGLPTTGLLLWHVKQHEDGTSWLLSPVELSFDELGGPPRYV